MVCQADSSGGCTCGFHLALAEFKRSLNNDELVRSFEETRLHHLTSEIAKIQQEQASKRRLRYMKRIDPFLKTMEQYGKVVEIFVNVEDVVAFIWGPMKFLLVTASSLSEAFDSLLDAYQTIWEQLPLFGAYGPTLESKPYIHTILVWIYKDILEFHREAIGYFKHRVWKQIFQAAWRGFLPKIDFIKKNMERHTRLLDHGVSFVQLEETENMRRGLQQRFETQRREEVDRRRREVISWLNPYPSQLKKYQDARLCPDAGSWLLNNDRFRGWFDPTFCTDPLLWITGIPGAGKSVLASVVVDAVRDLDDPDGDISVAYFFCQPHDDNANTFVAVARSILAQLVTQNASLISQVYEQSSLSGEVTLSTDDLAKRLLGDVLGCCKNTYIILDGIDSCSKKDRTEIVSVFRVAVESLPTNQMHDVRCLIVCQNDSVVRKGLANLPTICIGPADNKVDIENYWIECKKHLEADFGLLDLDIVKIVSAQAHGMFLYATIVFLHLKTLRTPEELRKELHRIPKQLDEVYGKIVERLLASDEFQPKDCLSMLGQLACAKRPLKWYEVRGAAAIDLDEQTVNFQKLPRGLKHTPYDLCGPLVEMRSDQTLEFIHPSARGQVRNIPHPSMSYFNIGSRYLLRTHFEDTSVHFNLSTLSLSYLSLPGIVKDGAHTMLIPLLLDSGYYAFLEYAISCWPLHLQEAVQTEKGSAPVDLEELEETVDIFLGHHWVETSSTDNTPKTTLAALSSMASFTSYLKICKAVAAAKRELTQHNLKELQEGPLDLAQILRKIRDTLAMCLESGNLTDAQKETLCTFYGPNWFKCSMMNCQYFHQGFPNRRQLDQHLARHQRPFVCLDEACDFHTFGYATKGDLQRHLLATHGIDVTDPMADLEFPSLPSAKSHGNGDGSPSKYPCPTCPKSFTRNHNLQNHLRAHRNVKPYPCGQCSQSFTRLHDCKRHQALHTGQKRFVCRGDLKGGGTWGCGREFARQDKLADHFKSKAGRKCIQPLFMEEANGTSGEEWNARVAEILSSRFILDPEQIKPLVTTISSFPESWVRVDGRENVNGVGQKLSESESQGSGLGNGGGR